MIVYNVTVNIDNDAHDEWLLWMKNIHIPDVMSTGLFIENRMFRVMVNEESGVTYSIQYSCKSMDELLEYQDKHSKRLQKDATDKFGNKFVAFRTILQKV